MNRLVFKILFSFLFLFHSFIVPAENKAGIKNESLKISVFDVDATPPVGTAMAYDVMQNSWDMSLRAKGIILTGIDRPVVLCSVDWIGIANDSYDVFRNEMAEAAGTTPDRVALHTLHQHDAPRSDFTSERLLKEAGLDPGGYDSKFDYVLIDRLKSAIKKAVSEAQPVTHIGTGQAEVFQVASNRRIFGEDGKVHGIRFSASPNKTLRDAPEGKIDPMVSIVSFWNEDVPVAVLSYYATHPQSYYRTGIPNPDFPGIARFLRQLEVPEALHVHFNGAGGDVAAGKYNDGSKVNRGILANRLADGMKRAWEATEKKKVEPGMVEWVTEPVRIPPSEKCFGEVASWEKSKDPEILQKNIMKIAYAERYNKNNYIRLTCLKAGNVRIVGLPAECFVEYQLFAKSVNPGLFVTVAAYGEYGAGYIPTPEAYNEGGYEVNVSKLAPEAGNNLKSAIEKILNK